MYVIVMWLITALITWFGLSAIMFVFSMGNFSSIGPYKKQYWKWSILLSIYITIPVIGWLIGIMHVSYAWNKKPKVESETYLVKNENEKKD